MVKKTIKAVISKKINELISSIESEEVRNLVKENTFVTGGCITSMLLNEEVNDFDLYFKTKETVVELAKYYVDKFKENNKDKILPASCVEEDPEDHDRIRILIESAGVLSEQDKSGVEDEDGITEGLVTEIEGKPRYRPIFITDNAITLSGKIQIIIRFWGEPEKVHRNYDFIHCTNYWTSWQDDLHLNVDALESTLSKNLFYVGSKYPLCSVIRTRKFIKRGWNINAGQYLKMLLQVSELDLTDIKILKDQLIGVDSAYFAALISAVEGEQEEDPSFELNASYLIEFIDKIF